MKKFHRFFSLFLCFCLLLGFGCTTVKVNADAWAASFALRSVAGSLIASGFDDIVKEPFLDACNTIVNSLSSSLGEALRLAYDEDYRRYTLTSVFVKEVINICISNSNVRSKLGISAGTTEDELSFIPAGTTIYVPTDSAMSDVDSITPEQVLLTGFEIQVIDSLNQSNATLNAIRNVLNGSLSRIDSYLYDLSFLSTVLSNKMDRLEMYLKTSIGGISDKMDRLEVYLKTSIGGISDKMDRLELYLKTSIGGISDKMDRLELYLKTSIGGISNKMDRLEVYLKTSIGDISGKLDTLAGKIDDLVVALTDVEVVTKPEIEVQAGTQTIVVSDYATLGQAFSAKMGWIPQIFDFLAELRSRLNSGTPPKVPIKLSAAEGDYDWGSDTYILDMSWYTKFKPSVDTIISGIMWLCFGWAIYKRIPDILSGVGITVENATEPRGNVWLGRAERAESLKYRSDRRADYYSNRGG